VRFGHGGKSGLITSQSSSSTNCFARQRVYSLRHFC
jgi:hypothetical protein